MERLIDRFKIFGDQLDCSIVDFEEAVNDFIKDKNVVSITPIVIGNNFTVTIHYKEIVG